MSGGFFAQYTVTFEEGETIYNQNEAGNCMFVIKDGQIGLYKNASGMTEEMGVLEKGDFFGELCILEHCSRTETAKALSSSSVVVIHQNMFVKMLKSNMEIAIRMLQKLSTKLRQSEEKIDKIFSRLAKVESEADHSETSDQTVKEPAVVGKLVSLASNRVFILNRDRNLVGRYDPVTSIKPEVDLTHEDDTRSVSRRHAIIFRRNNHFYVQEEIGVLNGTYVNGVKASSNSEQIPVRDQDMVNFGMLAFKFYITNDGEEESEKT